MLAMLWLQWSAVREHAQKFDFSQLSFYGDSKLNGNFGYADNNRDFTSVFTYF